MPHDYRDFDRKQDDKNDKSRQGQSDTNNPDQKSKHQSEEDAETLGEDMSL